MRPRRPLLGHRRPARRPDGPARPRRHLVGDRPGHRRRRRGRRRRSRWSGPWSATTSTSRCWPPTRGRRGCCWSTATAASGCSSSATPRTSTRRGAATASTPASATRSTSAGSWPPSCRAGRPESLLDSYEAERRPVGAADDRARPAARRRSWRRPSPRPSSTPTARPARRCAPSVARRPAGQGPGVPQPRPGARLRLPRLPRGRARRTARPGAARDHLRAVRASPARACRTSGCPTARRSTTCSATSFTLVRLGPARRRRRAQRGRGPAGHPAAGARPRAPAPAAHAATRPTWCSSAPTSTSPGAARAVADPAALLRTVVGAADGPNVAAPAPSPLEEIAR